MTNSRQPVNRRSIAIIVLAWFVLQIGGLFTPGLLDDVDSVYIEVAREMLHRHDFVTPTIDGIRFFDKPPLMYWLAASSMRVFGEHAWAARLPLAFAFLALLLSVYALGLRFYRQASPAGDPDRGALFSALILATAIGPYLYTRFFIPDILVCLWMTLAVHAFLLAIDRAAQEHPPRSPLYPSLVFAAALAFSLLTKGFIGLVFPIAFVVLYAALTRQLRLLPRLHLVASTAVFLAIALPWHILAALRNPAIPMPAGVGLPATAGWAWFYLYNEHIARFLGQRIPHDYGQTPVWLFWLYAALWMMPWATFLPAALRAVYPTLNLRARPAPSIQSREHEANLTVVLWPLIVLVFFTLSSRQEYYSLPALPALALLLGGFLADPRRTRAALLSHRYFLLPLTLFIAALCTWFAIRAPRPAPGTDLSTLLSSNPELYNLSLGHLFDLTGAAMGLFRGPLIAVAVGMTTLGLGSYLFRRKGRLYAANVSLAGGMAIVLMAAHEGLVRFNPILGSKPLADAIISAEQAHPQPALILIDGELTSGSTLLFYTRQPVHFVNGRVNGPWFGSFWPDAPQVFEDDASLRTLWAGPRRIFLLTYSPANRITDLSSAAPVHTLATAGGKTILSNR